MYVSGLSCATTRLTSGLQEVWIYQICVSHQEVGSHRNLPLWVTEPDTFMCTYLPIFM